MSDVAIKLKEETAACRLTQSRFGTHRSLSKGQVEKAAAVFGAQGSVVKARKRLLNTKCDEFQAVVSVLNAANAHWAIVTVPYPERGIRLIRRNAIADFVAKMEALNAQLAEKVKALDGVYQQLVADAKAELGDLFNQADYPPSLEGRFLLEWDFPSVTPPDYLKQINPALFEAEAAKITARFKEAVDLTEAAFAKEFADLVNTLADKLATPTGEGKKKVLRDANLANFQEFFARFDTLKVSDDEALAQIIAQAKDMLAGADPEKLRRDEGAKAAMHAGFAKIKASADQLVTARSRVFTVDED